ncbi:hypothetical protein [Hoyosella subflava]|uniref:hypothetical protein n=1 Tax=Hoyosella subflava TaxID=639313 RepID=UPI00178C3DD8|nr:hypothetical protein [Hoyosella subflava]
MARHSRIPSIVSKELQSFALSLCEATTRCACAYVSRSSFPIIDDSHSFFSQLIVIDQRFFRAAVGSAGPSDPDLARFTARFSLSDLPDFFVIV